NDGRSNGPKPDKFAGALSVMDARLLLFPVRTAFGGFAWATCPLILDRLRRDLGPLGIQLPGKTEDFQPGDGAALTTTESAVVRQGRVIIEDLDYPARSARVVDELAMWLAERAFPAGNDYEPFRQRIEKQLLVLDDTELTFLCKHATEVV